MDEATQGILPQHSAVIGPLAMLAAKEEVYSELAGSGDFEVAAITIMLEVEAAESGFS